MGVLACACSAGAPPTIEKTSEARCERYVGTEICAPQRQPGQVLSIPLMAEGPLGQPPPPSQLMIAAEHGELALIDEEEGQ